jgi:catechol-2,3-dioxygenase
VIKALNELEVITLFVEDLPAVKTFYTNVFGLEVISEDDESAVLKLKNVMINLLVAFEAHDLIARASVALGEHRRPFAADRQRHGRGRSDLRT